MESNIEKLKKLFKMNKELSDVNKQQEYNMSTSAIGGTSSIASTSGIAGTYVINSTVPSYTYTLPTTVPGGFLGGSGITFSTPVRANIISFTDISGKEIVRINLDGSVTWAEGYGVDEAAANLTRAFTLSVEIQSGITQAVKLKMRDSVFEDIIEIARQKGSLTADDLTYLLEASKIVEKLKGAKE